MASYPAFAQPKACAQGRTSPLPAGMLICVPARTNMPKSAHKSEIGPESGIMVQTATPKRLQPLVSTEMRRCPYRSAGRMPGLNLSPNPELFGS